MARETPPGKPDLGARLPSCADGVALPAWKPVPPRREKPTRGWSAFGASYLRVAISGGGCNGLSYKLRFAEAPKAGDILVRTSGVEVLVDPKSALYLRGTVLDYSDKMIGGGFKFSNPNAKASCSCGESFSL
jgi:iron-sulfur cluster assembly accessory protein